MKTKKSLVQQTADNLYSMIVEEGIFKPGEQLPNENTLSEMLEVSRSTLREAIRLLASQGIVSVYRGKGTYVNNDVTALNNMGLESMNRIRVRLKDLYETRLIFEPIIAYLACKRATDEELEKIFEIGKEVEKYILEGKNRTEIDQQFHAAIVSASHNNFLQELLPVINKAVNDSILINEGCRLPSEDILARDTLRDHALIMEFLKDRDAAGAKNAMRIHLHHGIKNLNINIGDDPIF